MKRKGLGKGKGKGYKNLQGRDPKIHSDSARGRKQPQKIPEYQMRTSNINNSPSDLIYNNFGIYMTKEISGRELDYYMQEKFDLTNHQDYEYVTNEKLNGEDVGVLFLMSSKGKGRWETSLGVKGFSKTNQKELFKGNYGLFKALKDKPKKHKETSFEKYKRTGLHEQERTDLFVDTLGRDRAEKLYKIWTNTYPKYVSLYGENPKQHTKEEVFMVKAKEEGFSEKELKLFDDL